MKFLTDHFLGTMVNFAVVLILGIVGSLIKKGVPKRFSDSIMAAVGICVLYIGIDGVMEAAPPVSEDCLLSPGLFKILVMILSMAVGTLLGELIDVDKWINKLGNLLERRFTAIGKGDSLANGFVSCSILFCVGAMTINGAIADAQGDPSLLLAKSVIDGISVFVMSSAMGLGCAFSSFFILVYQGLLTLAAFALVEVLSAATLTYMSVTGSLIIILLGTNVIGITRVKTANMIPAMFLPIAFEALLKLIFG